MKLIIALALAASAAPWVVSYKRTTKSNDAVSVEAQADGKVRLCLEVQCSILTAHEATELARVILTVIPPDAEKSFDELAEQAARDTDAYFCYRADTEWERKAFCTGLRVPITLRNTPPLSGYGRTHGKNLYIVIPFVSDDGARSALDRMSHEEPAR